MNKNLDEETILNPQLNKWISQMGHFQKLLIVDAGFPLNWKNKENILDLSLSANKPKFLDVYELILANLKIESVFLASETYGHNRKLYDEISKHNDFPMHTTTHEELKILALKEGILIIRTGEITPYANILISAGVSF